MMNGLTKNVGHKNHDAPSGPIDKSTIKRVLISRPNHRLGNLLMITPLVQELETTFPNAKIDLFIKGGLGSIVLGSYKNINEIISLPKKHFNHLPSYFYSWFKIKFNKYDLVINAVGGSSSGRLSTQLAKSTYKIFGELDEDFLKKNKGYQHMAKCPVYQLRDFLAGGENKKVGASVPSLNLMLRPTEIDAAKKILDDLVDKNKKTLAIFTYATGKKCYSKDWWAEFYKTLKTQFPDHNIVEVLPKENVSQIDFEAPTFYSKDIRQICAFIANAEVFIGADSGMMHLAIASQTPTVGLFSITDLSKYGPYNENNVAIDTNKVSIPESMEVINKTILR